MEVIEIVLPVFLVIVLGYVLRARGFLGDQTNSALARLVFYILAPILLFHSTSHTSLDRSLNLPALLVIAGASILISLTVYLAAVRSSPARRGVIAQGAHRSNMVFVGLPVVTYAYGNSVLGPVAIQIGLMVVLYNLLAVLVLTLPHQQASAREPAVWGRTFLEIIKNPLILGCCGGLFVSLVGISLPMSLDRSLELVGRAASPLALISVGAGLDFGRLRTDFRTASLVSLVKLIVYPALIYAGLLLIGQSGIDAQASVLVMASPTAVVSYIMALEMNGDEQLAGAIVIGSTCASLLTFIGWLVYFQLG